ncbi:hypothetical protein GGR52DRAFT_231783 [Hypoxylon sp. FL1284]|nr:hypothetical protein GGR52DRAFT_231783 [Hypoxylon sp. FL1284]
MDDPWYWDIDRVVQELCSTNRSWEPPSAQLKFPPLEQVQVALRHEEVDGHTLITYDQEELCDALGFRILRHKATLQHAIAVFRSRSKRYRLQQKRDFSAFNADNDDQQVGKDAGAKFAPAVSTALAPINQSPNQGSKIVQHTLGTSSDSAEKERVVPRLISTDVDVNVIRNIPTEADPILASRSLGTETDFDQMSLDETGDVLTDPAFHYLGDDAFTRFDIFDDTADDEAVSGGGDSHEFTITGPLASTGRCLQVHRLMQRQLMNGQGPRKLYRLKADMVPGSNNPDHDEILPVYGGSDEEYDSETWNEVEAERAEREMEQSQPGLSQDEVRAIIDSSIQQFASDWEQHKLPKLVKKAYQLWVNARQTGLRKSIDNNRNDLKLRDARIAKFSEGIILQNWPTEGELRERTEVLQQSVEDREYFSWVLGVITGPDEPEKPSSLPRGVAKQTRRPKPALADEEILTSESEDGLGDFIIDDEPSSPVATSMSFPMDVDDNTARMDIDDDTSLPSQPSRSTTLVLRNKPAKSCDNEVIVLSSSPTTAPSVSPGAAEGAEGGLQGTGSLPSTLVHNIDDLDPTEQQIATKLAEYDSYYLSLVFTLAKNMPPTDIWQLAMVPMLDKSGVISRALYISLKQLERETLGAIMLQLFDIYQGDTSYPLSCYKKLSPGEGMAKKTAAEKSLDQFKKFVAFLDRLSDRFDWRPRQPSMDGILDQGGEDENPADSDVEIDLSGSTDGRLIPSGSPSRIKVSRARERRIRAAESTRQETRRQLAESHRRRDLQRAKLENLIKSGLIKLDSNSQKIINESKDDEQEFIYVHPNIAPSMKDYQLDGVRFMWDQIVSSGTQQGCLLAHTMGLGKTMQIVTLLLAISEAANSDDRAIFSQIPYNLRQSKTLIVCPASLLDNWLDELWRWTTDDHKLGTFFKIDASSTPTLRKKNMTVWNRTGGVLLIGYSLFKQAVKDEEMYNILVEGPNLAIADEAHELKNPKTESHIAVSQIKTRSRIALTGTPLSNGATEYYSMIDWVAPGYLSTLHDFRVQYSNPIHKGFRADATPADLSGALKMLRVLKHEVSPLLQRVTISALKDEIPPKQEFVLTVPLHPIQKEGYEAFVSHHQGRKMLSGTLMSAQSLSLLTAHPSVFAAKLKEIQKQREKEVAQEEEETLDEQEHLSEQWDQKEQEEHGARAKATKRQNALFPPELLVEELKILNKERDLSEISLSWKIVLLMSIVEECKLRDDKMIIFSHSVRTLDYLEQTFRKKKFSLMRLDGLTRMNSRQDLVKEFNKGSTDVLLISTKAGGQGFNITSANRVVVFDSRFNPQDEAQAVGRAYRLGQTKPVFVYRFVCGGTVEEEAMKLQMFKMQLASRIVDKKNLITESIQLSQTIEMPTEAEQQDLGQHTGKDSVLDKIVEKHGSGIRAIATINTFGLEELEGAAMTSADRAEADKLIAEKEARRMAGPVEPSRIQNSPPIPTREPWPAPVSEPLAAPVREPLPAPVREPWPALTREPLPDPTAPMREPLPAPVGVPSAAGPYFGPSPTLAYPMGNGPANPNNPRPGYSNPYYSSPGAGSPSPAEQYARGVTFERDLMQAFTQPDPRLYDIPVDQARRTVVNIIAFLHMRQLRGYHEFEVQDILLEAARKCPRLVHMTVHDKLSVEVLVSYTPEQVMKQIMGFNLLSADAYKAHFERAPPFHAQGRLAGQPRADHPQDALPDKTFTRREDRKPRQPNSHRLEDMEALEAFIGPREAKQSSRDKNPRLPDWAKKALDRSASTLPSTAPPTTSSRSPMPPSR